MKTLIINSYPRFQSIGMAKTLSFAIMHFSVAFGVVWLLTGDFLIGGLVALVEPAVNTVAYYFHERIWQNFKAGHQNSNPSKRPCITC